VVIAVTYCLEKTNPESLFINLAEDSESSGLGTQPMGKEYHMDHIKQAITANKRGVRW